MKTVVMQSLSHKIVTNFMDNIESGELAVGDKIPTVCEMANIYNISNSTAAKIIKTLVSKGVINSIPGRGSFVIDSKQTSIANVHIKDSIYFFFNRNNKSVDSNYSIELFSQLQFIASQNNLSVKCISLTNNEILDYHLQQIKEDAIACVMDSGSRHNFSVPNNIPTVVFSIDETVSPCNVISADNYRGGWLAAEELFKSKNMQELIFIGGTPRKFSYIDRHFTDRLNGINDYCKAFNLPEAKVIKWDTRCKNGTNEVSKLLASENLEQKGLIIGSLAMYNEISKFACDNFNIAKLSEKHNIISYTDLIFPEQELEIPVIYTPLSVLVRECVDLILRLKKSAVKDNYYRVLISMSILYPPKKSKS